MEEDLSYYGNETLGVHVKNRQHKPCELLPASMLGRANSDCIIPTMHTLTLSTFILPPEIVLRLTPIL